MFPLPASSTPNDAKRLLFTSLARTLYDYVGEPNLMQSLNHVLACYFTRIRPIELERDVEIDGPLRFESLEATRINTVLKCESMPLTAVFKNELGQLSCLSGTLKTLQDYQNLVSYFMHYATVEKDCLEANLSYNGAGYNPLKFKIGSNARLASLKLFQFAQPPQSILLRYPDCWVEIHISLSYFRSHDYFSSELYYKHDLYNNAWSGGTWSSNHYSLQHQISLHQVSEEQLIYDWVNEYMNKVQQNQVDRINRYFYEISNIRIPNRYKAIEKLYCQVFEVDNGNFSGSSKTGELTVRIDNQKWQEYQQRYPLLKTIRLTDYQWLNDEESDDDDDAYYQGYQDPPYPPAAYHGNNMIYEQRDDDLLDEPEGGESEDEDDDHNNWIYEEPEDDMDDNLLDEPDDRENQDAKEEIELHEHPCTCVFCLAQCQVSVKRSVFCV